MSTKLVRIAIVEVITGDATLMARLGDQAPYVDRLPRMSKHSENFASITIEGETSGGRRRKEDQTFTLHVYCYDHDVAQECVEDLYRLFHVKGRWKPLPVTEGKALSRIEFEGSAPTLDSELTHKVLRIRIRAAFIAG